MNVSETLSYLQTNAQALRSLGATSMFLFGSTLNDTIDAAGDVDLFIDYDETSRFSLIDLAAMQRFLERLLSKKVDLTTRHSLDRLLKRRIEASATRVF